LTYVFSNAPEGTTWCALPSKYPHHHNMSLPPLQISCDTQWDRRTSGTSGRARLAGYVRLFAYKVLTVLRYYISFLLHLLLFSLRDCPTHIKYVFPKHFCSPCYGFRLFRKLSSEISCRSSSLSALSHTRKARSVHIHIPELAKIVRMCRFSIDVVKTEWDGDDDGAHLHSLYECSQLRHDT
jgi:hypothetical protein